MKKSKWFRLKAPYRVEINGKLVRRVAGDWITVGWQEGRLLIGKGIAEIPGQDVIREYAGSGTDAGILVIGSQAAAAFGLSDAEGKVNVKYSDTPWLPWGKTIIWNPLSRILLNLLPTGLSLLDTWEIAVPLYDKYSLATQEGTTADRELTKAIIRDLRVPMYDTNLLYVRKCENTTRLLSQWREERTQGDSDRLAFLRAFYRVKPYMLALPITWTGQHIDDDR